MVDVFIRSSRNLTPIRQAMFELCHLRWQLDPMAKISVLKDFPITDCRRMAEEFAVSNPYIFTDNDVLIMGKDWIKRGLEAMLSNPEYGACSTLSVVEGENLAKGSGVIYPMHAVGAPMWIRKGLMGDLPELTLDNECGEIQRHVEAKGYKEGLISGIRHNHIGNSFSGTGIHFWGY